MLGWESLGSIKKWLAKWQSEHSSSHYIPTNSISTSKQTININNKLASLVYNNLQYLYSHLPAIFWDQDCPVIYYKQQLFWLCPPWKALECLMGFLRRAPASDWPHNVARHILRNVWAQVLQVNSTWSWNANLSALCFGLEFLLYTLQTLIEPCYNYYNSVLKIDYFSEDKGYINTVKMEYEIIMSLSFLGLVFSMYISIVTK